MACCGQKKPQSNLVVWATPILPVLSWAITNHTLGLYALFTCVMWGYDGLAAAVCDLPSVDILSVVSLTDKLRSYLQSLPSVMTMAMNSKDNMLLVLIGNLALPVLPSEVSLSVVSWLVSLLRSGDDRHVWLRHIVSHKRSTATRY